MYNLTNLQCKMQGFQDTEEEKRGKNQWKAVSNKSNEFL